MLLFEFQRKSGTPFVKMGFSKVYASCEVNQLFINIGITAMLEGKVSEAVDKMFPFVPGFVERATEYMQAASMARVHKLYMELVHGLKKACSEEEVSSDMQLNVKGDIQRGKETIMKTLMSIVKNYIFYNFTC